jgi:hypothetical protein
MNGRSKWQAFLAIGAICCILVMNLEFGSSVVGWVVTTVPILLAVLAFVYGSLKEGEPDGLMLKCRRFLRSSPQLELATVMVWLGLVGLSIYSGVDVWKSSQLMTIGGNVEEANGALASNASVSLTIGSYKETLLATDGHFLFSKIDLKGEHPVSAEIKARWNEKQVAKELDLSVADLKKVTLRLPLGHAPFRVLYYLIGGHAIDFLLQGKVDSQWEKELAGQPFIAQNLTLGALSSEMVQFSEPFKASLLLTPADYSRSTPAEQANEQEVHNQAEQLARKYSGVPMFVGSDATIAAVQIGSGASSHDIRSLSDASNAWHAKISPYTNEPKGVNDLIYWRFGKREDLERFAGGRFPLPIAKWLQYVTKDNFPGDFCVFTMDSPGCGGGEEGVALHTRSAYLRIAVIENISSAPIHLGTFNAKENTSGGLRSRDEDEAVLARQQVEPKQWFPAEELKPNEKIVIPLEVSMRYDKDKNWDLYHLEKDANTDTVGQIRAQLGAKDAQSLRYYEGQSARNEDVPSANLIQMLDETGPSLGLEKEYIFGPSTKVDSLEVDDAEYPVRPLRPTVFAMRNGNETGSCPFLYAHSSLTNGWIKVGRLFYGANGEKKETFDSLNVAGFDGRLMIREEEEEVSYLRAIYVSALDAGGHVHHLYPSNLDSFPRTRGLIELRRGQSIEVSFALASRVSHDVRCVARGFYKPDVAEIARRVARR